MTSQNTPKGYRKHYSGLILPEDPYHIFSDQSESMPIFGSDDSCLYAAPQPLPRPDTHTFTRTMQPTPTSDYKTLLQMWNEATKSMTQQRQQRSTSILETANFCVFSFEVGINKKTEELTRLLIFVDRFRDLVSETEKLLADKDKSHNSQQTFANFWKKRYYSNSTNYYVGAKEIWNFSIPVLDSILTLSRNAEAKHQANLTPRLERMPEHYHAIKGNAHPNTSSTSNALVLTHAKAIHHEQDDRNYGVVGRKRNLKDPHHNATALTEHVILDYDFDGPVTNQFSMLCALTTLLTELHCKNELDNRSNNSIDKDPPETIPIISSVKTCSYIYDDATPTIQEFFFLKKQLTSASQAYAKKLLTTSQYLSFEDRQQLIAHLADQQL